VLDALALSEPMPNCYKFLAILLVSLIPVFGWAQEPNATAVQSGEVTEGNNSVASAAEPLETSGTTVAGGPETPLPAANNPGGDQFGLVAFFQSPLNLAMLAVMLFFFIVLWPQQRQMKAQQLALAQALAGLKKNDRVLTSGGIHGVVVQANSGESTIILRIDENSNARMTINRDAVVRVLSNETPTTKNN
jgi:preprotein translocase subunit YajC